MLTASDTLALATTVAVVLSSVGAERAPQQLTWALLWIPAMLVVFKIYGLYDRDDKRLSHSTIDDLPSGFHAMLIGTLGLWGFLTLVGEEPLFFLEALAVLALGLILTLLARALTRRLVNRLTARERILLVGGGAPAELLLHKLRRHPSYRLEICGYLADRPERTSLRGHGVPWLGPVGDFDRVCTDVRADRVVIASPEVDDQVLTDLIRRANQAAVTISLLPSTVDVLGPATVLDDLEGLTVIGINPVRFTRSTWLLKRALDVTVAATGLLVFAVALPFLALAIKLDSPGPVFFTQARQGRGGRRFRLFKLRTMVADAERQIQALREQSAHEAWLQLDSDPRVTRFGRLLRRTSVDELPQLWNVLRGDMSLVGPRPMPLDTDGHISGWGRRRLDLTPGITGMWQALGRVSIPFEEMLKLDYLYVTNWSLWGDVRLLLRTVPVVLNRRGAN